MTPERLFIIVVVVLKALAALCFLGKQRWLVGIYWIGCAQVDLMVLLMEWRGTR